MRGFFKKKKKKEKKKKSDNPIMDLFGRTLNKKESDVLSDLLSLSLKEFENELQNKKLSSARIDQEIEQIAVGNYRSFVDSSKMCT